MKKDDLIQLKIKINGRILAVWLPVGEVKPGDKVSDVSLGKAKTDQEVRDVIPWVAGWGVEKV